MDGIHAHVNHVSGSRCAETSKGVRRTAEVPRKLSRLHKPETMSLEAWQIVLRRQVGREETFTLTERWRDQPIFSEFHVTNPKSRNTYRFVIRGSSPGTNVCSCPNLATNTLGTCKHVEFVSEEVEEGHSEAEEGYRLDPAVRRSPKLAG